MRVLGDRVLVRPTPPPTQTASGIELAWKYLPPEVTGTVVALGDGPRAEDGTLLPHRVTVGDEAVFAAESGHDVVVDGERYIVLREDDLLAVFA
jgi:chaperonin GroES